MHGLPSSQPSFYNALEVLFRCPMESPRTASPVHWWSQLAGIKGVILGVVLYRSCLLMTERNSTKHAFTNLDEPNA